MSELRLLAHNLNPGILFIADNKGPFSMINCDTEIRMVE